jgi:hypothetical protein
MNNPIERIEMLDLTLFDPIFSQTEPGDKRSLLAVQRSVARKYKEYTYLEIGSHLGGSLQQHLVDPRCRRIYSIDPRPFQQPDDRDPGFVCYYGDNSSRKMLELLGNIGQGDIARIECIEMDASKIDRETITQPPEFVFIDGEHTKTAVLSDFRFCDSVVHDHGAILFHDFTIIHAAIFEILDTLKKRRRFHLPLKLEGDVFAIFYDAGLVHSDPYLEGIFRNSRYFLPGFRFRNWLKRMLPGGLVKAIQAKRRAMRLRDAGHIGGQN